MWLTWSFCCVAAQFAPFGKGEVLLPMLEILVMVITEHIFGNLVLRYCVLPLFP